MKPLKPIVRWWKALFQRESTERDLDDEIQLHLEMETAKNIRGGMPADQARREGTASPSAESTRSRKLTVTAVERGGSRMWWPIRVSPCGPFVAIRFSPRQRS